MLEKYNYNDNIFYLTLKIKLLQESSKLDINNENLLKNIVNNIFFISQSIQDFFISLKNTSIIQNRTSHLKNLQRLGKKMITLLTEIIEGKSVNSKYLKDYFDKFNLIISMLSDNKEEIKLIITENNQKPQEEKLIISETEYKFLFSNEENK